MGVSVCGRGQCNDVGGVSAGSECMHMHMSV